MSLHLLENICEELKACQAVSSTREFCESWLAKDESYMRVLRFHSAAPSAGVLATLWVWVCSCSAATTLDSRDESLTRFVQQSQYICKIWTSEPDRFILDTIHQMPGLNT